MPTTIEQYDRAFVLIEEATSALELMKALNAENIDEDTFKTHLSKNYGEILSYKDAMAEFDKETLESGGVLGYVKAVEMDDDLTVDRYVSEKIGEMKVFYNNSDLTTEKAIELFEDYVRCVVVSNSINNNAHLSSKSNSLV